MTVLFFPCSRTQIGSSAGAKTPLQEDSTATNRQQEQKVTGEEGELVVPKHLVPMGRVPELNKTSILLKEHHLKGIVAAIPKRMRQANWQLLYSTARHGYSLQSLYRRAAGFAPTILVIKDPAEHIFGSYCSEPWKIAPRFYGTGESFVFQLEVRGAHSLIIMLIDSKRCWDVDAQLCLALWVPCA